jgi:DNA-directed RNA polymerase specialized sigma subunit
MLRGIIVLTSEDYMPLKDPKNQKKIQDFLIEHAPLIGQVVGSLKSKGHIPSDAEDNHDVHYAGFYGLMDAIHKYNPEAGANLQSQSNENPFAKYARTRISGKILDLVHGSSEIPKQVRKRAKNLEILEQQQRSAAPETEES